jgi:hypothetical protein
MYKTVKIKTGYGFKSLCILLLMVVNCFVHIIVLLFHYEIMYLPVLIFTVLYILLLLIKSVLFTFD